LIAAGACIGLALSLLIGRVLGSLLYEVGTLDPVVLLAAPLLLAAVSLCVTWIPARRAARVDPLVALRSD
jgi:ABC-type antimicrobial peptide transport system permease subunit